MVGGSPRGVIHTTEVAVETSAAPFYHISFFEITPGVVSIVQWRSFGVASLALVNGPDPMQTNRQGDVCVNAVIVGNAADSPNLSDAMIEAIGDFVRWCADELKIPIEGPADWCGSEGYGTDGDCRFSISEWETWSGWCGHQHVPDDNSHWDPGELPWDRIAAHAEKGAATVAEGKLTKAEEAAIARLKDLGIYTAGTDDEPGEIFEAVTKDTLAVFLVRTFDAAVAAAISAQSDNDDVPAHAHTVQVTLS